MTQEQDHPEGKNEQFIDFLSTNTIKNSVTYTVLANEKGGSVDDVIIFKFDVNNYTLVVNASNREKDLNHLRQVSKNYNVEIFPLYQDELLKQPEAPVTQNKMLGHGLFPLRQEYSG